MRANAASIVTDTSLKGSAINQIKGHRTMARTARGQQTTHNKHPATTTNKVFTDSVSGRNTPITTTTILKDSRAENPDPTAISMPST